MRTHSGASSICAEGSGSPPIAACVAAEVRTHWRLFFTTKPPGRGTGLGLSSVYGFVKESGGNATIHGGPDRGTTINLYLLVVATQETLVDPGSDKKANAAGGAALREVLSHVA
jgi:hypothetical protein